MKKIKIYVVCLALLGLTLNAVPFNKETNLPSEDLFICKGSGAKCFSILWGLIVVYKKASDDAPFIDDDKGGGGSPTPADNDDVNGHEPF